MTRCTFVLMLSPIMFCSAADLERLPVRVTWGHSFGTRDAPGVQVHADGGMAVESLARTGPTDGAKDGLRFILTVPKRDEPRLQRLHIIWADLLAAADADTARRLGQDAAMDPHAPRLYVQTRADGTEGFAVTINQLKNARALWVPSLDVYVTTGEPFVEFAAHQQSLKAWQGKRILDQIETAPDASYEDYKSRWEDMGDPSYTNPQPTGAGHIVGLAWDSSIHKFGVDRGAGVRNDFGNPDRFRFWFEFGDINKGLVGAWKSQSLHNGLPIMTTVIDREGVRYEVEQFAYPLDGIPKERRGDSRMVLMQRLRLTALNGQAIRVPVTMSHRRSLPSSLSRIFEVVRTGSRLTVRNHSFGQTVLEISGTDGEPLWSGVRDYDNSGMHRVNLTIPVDIPARGNREIVVKLPSPMLDAAGADVLAKLDYETAKREAIGFWAAWIERGAQFEVPEKAVNDLFRASLWHALRLPRRHGAGEKTRIDLPYSNFAYDQNGTPWPVNQAVYVDYMLFGLRGYDDVAAEELLAQYRNNQEINGHVSGYANWGVYTPSMLYAVAQNYLLSGDRTALERVLPQSLKALEWCLDQVRASEQRSGTGQGLVSGPLNDLTGEGVWAFNQAYMFAGLETFGRVLEQLGNPLGAEARASARRLAAAVDKAFRTASAKSPLVELRDHTWVPYVPCEAHTYRRIMDDWYPTDVDTGAVHMLRLGALPPASNLGDWLLNDHEDNLFFRGWGIANEPVYNQHATAYLARDQVKAVIRTFYSYMASAFSHSALEPVEHRFTHGQYFGPPSTDGAWFELYRNMLIYEREDDALLLAGFTPRPWLAGDQRIEVKRAPTRFGPLSMTLRNNIGKSQLEADIQLSGRARPSSLLVRFRHPLSRQIQNVTVNGQNWTDFDPAKEWVRIQAPAEKSYSIAVRY